MRIGILMDLAPRKLGSFEHWLVEMSRLARSRGHSVDVFGRNPIHPAVAQSWSEAGVGWFDLEELSRRPLQAVRTLSRYDVLQLHLIANRSPTAFLAYAAYPAKVVFVDHDSTEPRPVGSRLAILRKRVLDVLTTLRTDSVVGVSDFITRRAQERFGSRVQGRTIYNGIDLSRFAALPLKHPRGRHCRLAAVANLIPEKGMHVLLRAFAATRDKSSTLRIVGDGPQLGTLIELARELGVDDRVKFLGLRDDVPSILSNIDVFVHPALWTEAFGYTIAEAMAAGAAVIASNVGGIPELLEDGQSGLLVEPGNPEALAQAIDSLVAEPDRRNELGARAQLRIKKLFTLEKSIADHVDWLEWRAAKHPDTVTRTPSLPRTSLGAEDVPETAPFLAPAAFEAPEAGAKPEGRAR